MKDERDISRRSFLRRLGALGAAGLGAAGVLSACGGGEEAGAGAEGAAAAGAEFECTDVSGLSDQAVQMRETLEYIDESPYEDRVCNNCQFWIPPESGEQCGGCKILQGPVHPQGYCNSWAAQVAA